MPALGAAEGAALDVANSPLGCHEEKPTDHYNLSSLRQCAVRELHGRSAASHRRLLKQVR